MTPTALAAYVRFKTGTNSTTLTNANLIIIGNVVKDRLVLEALDADEDLFLVPTTLDLVASATSREYPLHSNILSRIKRVEAKLDASNYIKLTEFDLPQHKKPISTEADIVAHFSNIEGGAEYDIMRKALWIYSGTITAVTDGLKIWLSTWPQDLSSMASTTDMSVDPTTTTHGIPKALHGVLATGMIIEWKESRDKPIPLKESELRYDDDVEKAISKLKKANYDREVIGLIPEDDGQEY